MTSKNDRGVKMGRRWFESMQSFADAAPGLNSDEHLFLIGLAPKQQYFKKEESFSTTYYSALNYLLHAARKYAFHNRFTRNKFNRHLVEFIEDWSSNHPEEYLPLEVYYNRLSQASSSQAAHMCG